MSKELAIPKFRGSELTDLKRCPQKWWWAYREGLRPKRVQDALWFGELVHISLANWYLPGLKRGPHPAETFVTLAKDEIRYHKTAEATEEEVAKWTDLRELGEVMLDGYVQLYGQDLSWDVIAPEQTFSLDIPWPEHWGEQSRKFLATYVGTFDMVYRDLTTGWIWLGEHKTAASVQLGHLPLDDQAGRYWAVAHRALLSQGLISKTDRLSGIMYNFLRKALPDPRPVDAQGYVVNKPVKAHYLEALKGAEALNGKESLTALEEIAAIHKVEVLGDRSKVQPKPIFVRHQVKRTRAEQKSQLLRIQTDAEVLEMYRRKDIPLTKTTHKSCERWCGYYEMCLMQENSGNWKDLRSIGYTVEDPYASHRKSTDEQGSFELS